jgi:hypothetical protein
MTPYVARPFPSSWLRNIKRYATAVHVP